MTVYRRGGLIHGVTGPGVPRMAARIDLRAYAPRAAVDWHAAVKVWPMLRNDLLGTCVPAMALHTCQMRLANGRGYQWLPTDDQVTKLYTKYSGYNPITGVPDNGTPVEALMNGWGSQGIQLGDQLLDVSQHISVNPRNLSEVRLGIDWFVGAGLSVALPLGSQDVTDTFDYPLEESSLPKWEAGSWDGHEILCGKYDADDFYVISWGQEFKMTERYFQRYVTAVDTGISSLILDTTDTSPDHMTRAEVLSKLTTFA